jgi:CubicO group peptidase (beta-lactamase class C family)
MSEKKPTASVTPRHPDLRGKVDDAFAAVADALRRQIEDGRHLGGALCVYHKGKPVVDVVFGDRDASGEPWEPETMVVAFSTTKGVASLAVHILADRGAIEYDKPVSYYWPSFARNGKERIEVRHLLSHEAGLHRIRDLVKDPDWILDWEMMVSIVEAMEPAYEPGTANGYHATSYGWLVGELVRRVSGEDISTFVRREIAEPLGLDGCHIGIDRSEASRLARLVLTEPGAGPGVLVENATGSALEEGAKAIAPGFERILANDLEILEVPLPAGNGVFTARSLAKLYAAMSLPPEGSDTPIIGRRTLELAATLQNTRPDLVIGLPIGWRLGYHSVFSPAGMLENAIGHFGFGGSGAFLDIDRQLAIALVVNGISLSFLSNMRLVEIGAAAIQCADRAGSDT